MKLSEWIAGRHGALSQLTRESGLAYSTVHRAVHKPDGATVKVARALSEATNGVVTIAEIRLPDDELRRLGLLPTDHVKPRKRRAA